jgi:large subunit ribosomal protein L31e
VYKRTNKAVKILQDYLVRHTKSEKVSLDNGLNHYLWSRGASKPPRKVQIKAVKDSEGKVIASLLK